MSQQSHKVILHIDGDAFFVSCEMSINPALRDKPVITGHERGIASALSYEAKRRGITRGMPIWQVRQICPDAIIIPSDYRLYEIFSSRMLAIIRRFTEHVEAYSIDECFADITDIIKKTPGDTFEEKSFSIVQQIKQTLQTELGMTFSCGIGPTKVLAKVASKWQKPDGLTIISPCTITKFLANVPISKVWGVGPKSSVYLQKNGITSALDFINKPYSWISEMTDKGLQQIWYELKGENTFDDFSHVEKLPKSIRASRSFSPASSNTSFVFSQLVKNIEEACNRAREENLVANEIALFLKTKEFRYEGGHITLTDATAIPQEINKAIYPLFIKIFNKKNSYRTTGITLYKLRTIDTIQKSLFSDVKSQNAWRNVYKSLDTLNKKFGHATIHTAASLKALQHSAKSHKREEGIRQRHKVSSIEGLKRLTIPYLGEVI